MATIAIVTADKTHNAATRTKTAVDGLGHASTLFNMSEVTNTNLLTFDLIMLPRTLSTDGAYGACLGYLEAYLNTSHIPVLIGFNSLTASDTITTGFAKDLKLISSQSVADSRGPAIRASASHPVWVGSSVTPPADVSVLLAADFMGKVNTTGAYAGTTIATFSAGDPAPTILLASRGAADVTGVGVFGANIGYVGWLYGRNDYSVVGKTVLGQLIAWAISPGAVIRGTVEDNLGAPLVRTVRAYLRSSGQLVGSAISEADGTFEIVVVNPTDLHYVVALDELAGEKNALIKDRVTPYAA